MKFVVLCSSRGTVFASTLERIRDGSVTAACLGLVADKAERTCVATAKAAGLPVRIVPRIKGEAREDFDKRVDAAIRALGADESTLVACMGWMFILSPWFVAQWRNRILNVHPALLPKHPGDHAHDLVLAAGDTVSGMTIHLIDEGVDTGPTLLQKECPVLKGDTVDTLKARVQALEKEWFPKLLQMLETGDMKLPS
ncbi:MAG TPA: phosphoribosylglycinamide formyltransferase [Candidatus Peribacteria bacterium]|nr:phosphoribosylglycinamide formyltransferase [Candidatus Peribacteria bacterium]